jgi:hypothetical protein
MTKKQECPCGFPGPHSPTTCATFSRCSGDNPCDEKSCFFVAVINAYPPGPEMHDIFREAGWCGHE